MSYADDLAKDRDKYLRQRNKLISVLNDLLNGEPTAKKDAELLIRSINKSDPIANLVERLAR